MSSQEQLPSPLVEDESKKRPREEEEEEEEEPAKKRLHREEEEKRWTREHFKKYGYRDEIYETYPRGFIQNIVDFSYTSSEVKAKLPEAFELYKDTELFWHTMTVASVIRPIIAAKDKLADYLTGVVGGVMTETMRRDVKEAIGRLESLQHHYMHEVTAYSEETILNFWRSAAEQMAASALYGLKKRFEVYIRRNRNDLPLRFWRKMSAGVYVLRDEKNRRDYKLKVDAPDGDAKEQFEKWIDAIFLPLLLAQQTVGYEGPADLIYVLHDKDIFGVFRDEDSAAPASKGGMSSYWNPNFRLTTSYRTGFLPLPMEYFDEVDNNDKEEPFPIEEKGEKAVYTIGNPADFAQRSDKMFTAALGALRGK